MNPKTALLVSACKFHHKLLFANWCIYPVGTVRREELQTRRILMHQGKCLVTEFTELAPVRNLRRGPRCLEVSVGADAVVPAQ